MKRKRSPPRVVFNASVLLSALRSPKGGSGELLKLLRKNRFVGIVSETILDEALNHADRIPLSREQLQKEIGSYFPTILPAPQEHSVSRYKRLMLDEGDAHLFATYQEARCDALVSLDKHHVLALKGKLKGVVVVAPGELIRNFSKGVCTQYRI